MASDGPWRDRPIESVDPGGKLWEIAAAAPGDRLHRLSRRRSRASPACIEHTYGNRFTLGEPDGSKSARVEALSQMLVQAGLKAPVRTNIRDEIWVKLWGNLAFNPLSALTASTLDRLAFQPDLRAAARAMMEEAAAGGRSAGRSNFADRCRQAHRRRRRSGRAQDLHAARPGTRPADGNRRPAGRGGRVGGSDRAQDAVIAGPSSPWYASAHGRQDAIRKIDGAADGERGPSIAWPPAAWLLYLSPLPGSGLPLSSTAVVVTGPMPTSSSTVGSLLPSLAPS